MNRAGRDRYDETGGSGAGDRFRGMLALLLALRRGYVKVGGADA